MDLNLQKLKKSRFETLYYKYFINNQILQNLQFLNIILAQLCNIHMYDFIATLNINNSTFALYIYTGSYVVCK